MPLLKRKDFEKTKPPEKLRDDEEVFFCEQTKEIFRNYEDYFERVMLISSMVWSCSFTGRPNLTYAEALESEKEAKEILRQFPRAIKGPMIVTASMTKRSALSELLDDVFGFVKDRFFTDERVDVLFGSKYRCCHVKEVIASTQTDTTSPVKADKLRYKVEAVDDKQPKEWVAMPENIKRDKGVFTKDKCKLFLKQHIENSNNMLRIKDASYKKYVTETGLSVASIFMGKAPDFEKSKRLIELQEKAKKKIELNGQSSKKKKPSADAKSPTTSSGSKKKKSDGSKGDKKQNTMDKYLNKSDSAAGSSKSSKPKMTQEQREEAARKLKEEMERRKKEQEEREAERKRKLEEERAELNAQVTLAIKDFNQLREDLELQDQKPLPVPKKVSPLIGEKRFGDFVQILEFLGSFAELLSIKDKFPNGINMATLERALLVKEINGPLTDIVQVLLSTIFSLQIEEANEVNMQFDPKFELSQRRADVENLRNAARVGVWCQKHYSTYLNELVMDTYTLSELLRLHFLSSGALINGQGSNWRYQQRGGYQSHDDPGYIFCQRHPEIVKSLAQRTIYELSLNDQIKIIRCLIDQILTYSSVRDLIETRLEKAQKARFQYKTMCFAEKRREETIQSEKRKLKEEHRKLVAEFKGPKSEQDELRKTKEAEYEAKCSVWQRQSDIEKTKFLKESHKLKEEFFDYQVYLGQDRAGRTYWLFDSLPGLFVEHDLSQTGSCMEKVTENLPGLANCPSDQRNKFIRQMVIDQRKSTTNDKDKENKSDNGRTQAQPQQQPTVNGLLKPEKSETEVAEVPVEPSNFSPEQLMMCTADRATCPVHSQKPPNHILWGYYNTQEELDALIAGLNARGFREKQLRENLEIERDLIVNHIKWCPVDKLSIDESTQPKVLKAITAEGSRKYIYSQQVDIEAGVNVESIIEQTLRQDLLEFEYKLKIGYLGDLKVKDRDAWRAAIENFEYDSQTDSLRWGIDGKLHEGRTLLNGEASDNDNSGSDDEDNKNDSKNEGEEEEANYGSIKYDPGHDLGRSSDVETEDTEDELVPVKAFDSTLSKVHSLASALLQIEQGIDQKFIRLPFGPKKDFKDKDTQARKDTERRRKLQRWEESLMRSTTLSQVYLHYNILFDAITWSRSAARTNCSVCRRAKDPEFTLLCDDCNKGYHTYCLKPKLKVIPEGNWYCPKCHPEDFVVKRNQRKRKVFQEVEEVEEEADEEDEDEPEDDENDFDDADSEYEEEKPKKKRNSKPPPSKKRKTQLADLFGSRRNRSAATVDDDDVGESSRRSSILEERSSRRTSKRTRKEESESEEDSQDDVPLATVKTRRSETGRKRPSWRHLLDEESDDDEEKPLTRTRRSHRNSEEPVDRRRSNRRENVDENLTLHAPTLYALLEDISKQDCAWPFSRPVRSKEVPDYKKIIKHPMDFAKIKSKLNMGDYKTDYDMMNDIQLVFTNCDVYNNTESEIYHAGVKLEKFVQKKCKEYKLPFRPSDMLKDFTANDDGEADESIGDNKRRSSKRK